MKKCFIIIFFFLVLCSYSQKLFCRVYSKDLELIELFTENYDSIKLANNLILKKVYNKYKKHSVFVHVSPDSSKIDFINKKSLLEKFFIIQNSKSFPINIDYDLFFKDKDTNFLLPEFRFYYFDSIHDKVFLFETKNKMLNGEVTVLNRKNYIPCLSYFYINNILKLRISFDGNGYINALISYPENDSYYFLRLPNMNDVITITD